MNMTPAFTIVCRKCTSSLECFGVFDPTTVINVMQCFARRHRHGTLFWKNAPVAIEAAASTHASALTEGK